MDKRNERLRGDKLQKFGGHVAKAYCKSEVFETFSAFEILDINFQIGVISICTVKHMNPSQTRVARFRTSLIGR